MAKNFGAVELARLKGIAARAQQVCTQARDIFNERAGDKARAEIALQRAEATFANALRAYESARDAMGVQKPADGFDACYGSPTMGK